MEVLNEWLKHSFNENSVIWLMISAGVGGLIGSTIKYVFEQVITPQTSYKRKAKLALKRFSNPLLLAADTLARIVELFLENTDRDWLREVSGDKASEYFKLNILYCFGKYFGWCKIIEDNVLFEIDTSYSRKAKEFTKKFYRVYKGLNSFYYFEKIIKEEVSSRRLVEKASINRLYIQAIGEVMVKEPVDKEGRPDIMNFTAFVHAYRTDDTFREWFEPVLIVLRAVKQEENNLYWCRMVIFLLNLQSFINFYDPQSKFTKKRAFNFIHTTHPKFQEQVHKELSLQDQRELIRNVENDTTKR